MIHPSAGHVTRLGSPCTPMTKLYRSCTRLDGHVTSSTRYNCTALSFCGPTFRGLSQCQTPKERVHAQTYDSISSLLRTRSSIVSICKAHRAPAQPRNPGWNRSAIGCQSHLRAKRARYIWLRARWREAPSSELRRGSGGAAPSGVQGRSPWWGAWGGEAPRKNFQKKGLF